MDDGFDWIREIRGTPFGQYDNFIVWVDRELTQMDRDMFESDTYLHTQKHNRGLFQMVVPIIGCYYRFYKTKHGKHWISGGNDRNTFNNTNNHYEHIPTWAEFNFSDIYG